MSHSSNTSMENAIEALLSKAKTRGLSLEVLGVDRSATAIAFQSRKMEQFSFSETRQIGVRLIDGQHEGVAFSESIDSQSLDNLLDEAVANSKMIEREWISELQPATQLPSMDDLYNEALDAVTTAQKIEQASRLEGAALDFDQRIVNVPYSRLSDSRQQSWIANTNGLFGTYRSNGCFAYARCLAKDVDGNVMAGEVEMQRDFGALDAGRVAATAARKTISRLGAKRPETGRYTVVFENRVAEQLVGKMANYFNAKSVDEKSSPLAGKLGQKVFSNEFTLTDDPFFKDGLSNRPFDDEGFASQSTELVKNGVLSSFLTNSILARKLKLPHTASAARSPSTDLEISTSNLIVTPGSQSLEALLNADNKVILITEILGSAGFRSTSGDFSFPVEGYLYENGKVSAPLKDFLISGNILQLFSTVEAVGQDQLAPIGGIVCPSLLVRDLNVAGQSKN